MHHKIRECHALRPYNSQEYHGLPPVGLAGSRVFAATPTLAEGSQMTRAVLLASAMLALFLAIADFASAPDSSQAVAMLFAGL